MWGGIGAVIYILTPHPSIATVVGFATSGAIAGYMVQKRRWNKKQLQDNNRPHMGAEA